MSMSTLRHVCLGIVWHRRTFRSKASTSCFTAKPHSRCEVSEGSFGYDLRAYLVLWGHIASTLFPLARITQGGQPLQTESAGRSALFSMSKSMPSASFANWSFVASFTVSSRTRSAPRSPNRRCGSVVCACTALPVRSPTHLHLGRRGVVPRQSGHVHAWASSANAAAPMRGLHALRVPAADRTACMPSTLRVPCATTRIVSLWR